MHRKMAKALFKFLLTITIVLISGPGQVSASALFNSLNKTGMPELAVHNVFQGIEKDQPEWISTDAGHMQLVFKYDAVEVEEDETEQEEKHLSDAFSYIELSFFTH